MKIYNTKTRNATKHYFTFLFYKAILCKELVKDESNSDNFLKNSIIGKRNIDPTEPCCISVNSSLCSIYNLVYVWKY